MTLTAPTVAMLLKMSEIASHADQQKRLALDGDEDVRVAVDPLDDLLQVPQAVLHAARGVLDQEVVLASLLHLVHHVRDDDADKLQDGDEQRAKRGRAGVEPRHLAETL